jgi:hypothetical protein
MVGSCNNTEKGRGLLATFQLYWWRKTLGALRAVHYFRNEQAPE